MAADLTPRERAERSAEAMWAGDQASAWIGMTIESIDEGMAELALTVQPHHTNGHGICHGGITFTLADSAFAFACNSRNLSTVAQHNVVSFLKPVKSGTRLLARAEEVSLSGRSGIYDVRVTDHSGQVVAEMRGFSRAIGGHLFDEAAFEDAPEKGKGT